MAAHMKLNDLWLRARVHLDAADLAFIALRLVIFSGGIGWLIFADIPLETVRYVSAIFTYFAVYCIIIYAWLFFSPQKKNLVYGFALFFDLMYSCLLIKVTGGFESSFFNGLYLVTALYSFYFGLAPGTAIAAVSGALYYISCLDDFHTLHWTDFLVRVSFLFLLAVPLGMLSQKLKRDKRKIEDLNSDLQGYIEELRNVQGKLIQVEKLSALGRLTADVAHEIRNPLTSIGGFARRLHKKLNEGSKEKGYAEVVVNEVDRLEKILRDVLSFSREAKYRFEYQGIGSAVSDSVRAFEEVCADQGIQIKQEFDPSLPKVLIDSDQVRQAVNNLISNSVDAMPKGGDLSIRTYMEELYDVSYVVVEVSDSGPGIHHESLYRIFEPFYTTKEIGVGTGLGLAICKKILDEHNGLIFADSDEGKGTTFKLFFPYQSQKNGSRIKCWEFHKCGVEKAEGAANMRCPAYPDYGRICWAIAGTFCGKRVSGAIAQKLGNCKKCSFYQGVVVEKDI